MLREVPIFAVLHGPHKRLENILHTLRDSFTKVNTGTVLVLVPVIAETARRILSIEVLSEWIIKSPPFGQTCIFQVDLQLVHGEYPCQEPAPRHRMYGNASEAPQ